MIWMPASNVSNWPIAGVRFRPQADVDRSQNRTSNRSKAEIQEISAPTSESLRFLNSSLTTRMLSSIAGYPR